jgi:hypothetical protein
MMRATQTIINRGLRYDTCAYPRKKNTQSHLVKKLLLVIKEINESSCIANIIHVHTNKRMIAVS